VFGHLRCGRSFLRAAALSVSIFAAQHGYLVALLHMGVVLVSLYLVFASRRFPVATSEVAAGELSVG